jgi:hypothetical protein
MKRCLHLVLGDEDIIALLQILVDAGAAGALQLSGNLFDKYHVS